jgi:transglutaminase-like putative cysteine protease
MQIPALGQVQRVEARTTANLSRTLRLRGFEATLRSSEVRFAAQGSIVGDTLLIIDLESAGSRQTVRIPLTQPPVLPGLVPLHLALSRQLAVGSSFVFPTFDPLTLGQRDVRVTVVAESTLVVADSADQPEGQTRWIPARWDTVLAWQVVQEMGDMRMEVWIDELGQLVSAVSPVGFRMERTAYEIAYENFQRGAAIPSLGAAGGDVIRQTAIASNVPLAVEGISRLRVRLGGVNLDGFDLSGGRQILSGDTLEIRREPRTMLSARYRLPNTDAALSRYLAPEPLIQSRDPRLEAQARQIVGRVRTAHQTVERLNQWVYRELEKRVTVSVPSALEVLESRRGDCNEHTVLFVALARAVGIPARTAAGLVYLDGSFYYHAWPEVYLDDWVAVDPTFGQFPADAAHLRFTVGGLARQVELVRLIGRLTIDVLETTSE